MDRNVFLRLDWFLFQLTQSHRISHTYHYLHSLSFIYQESYSKPTLFASPAYRCCSSCKCQRVILVCIICCIIIVIWLHNYFVWFNYFKYQMVAETKISKEGKFFFSKIYSYNSTDFIFDLPKVIIWVILTIINMI